MRHGNGHVSGLTTLQSRIGAPKAAVKLQGEVTIFDEIITPRPDQATRVFPSLVAVSFMANVDPNDPFTDWNSMATMVAKNFPK